MPNGIAALWTESLLCSGVAWWHEENSFTFLVGQNNAQG